MIVGGLEKVNEAANTVGGRVKDKLTFTEQGSDEKNDLTGREKQRNNTVTSPTPAAVPEKKSEEELIRGEIRSKIARQTNLLEETLQFCCPKESQSDVKKIISHWKNILDAGECQVLLKHFEKICDKGGDVPKIWLRFLKDHGLVPMDDTVEQIVVGTGNRGKYINGMNIPDGVCALIIKHPWLFEGELCCKGVLEQLPESNEAEPEES